MNKPTNKKLSIVKLGDRNPRPLRLINGPNMSSENDVDNPRSRRRDVTLEEQRVYTKLEQISTKLENIIRVEEQQIALEANHRRLENRVDDHGGHIESIIRDQSGINIRMAQFEGLRAEVDALKRNQNTYSGSLADTREKQNGIMSSIKTSVGIATFIVIVIPVLMMVIGKYTNKVEPTKPAISTPKN